MKADDLTYTPLGNATINGGVIFDEKGNQFHFTLDEPPMKIFETPQKIYRYVADTWIQAEQMLADELGVQVNEINQYIIDRYEL